MDLKDIPVRIINLDRRTDRWNKLKNTNFGFNSVERFSAYDGSKETDFNDAADMTKLTIDSGMRRYHEEISTKGAYACYKSHIALWKELIASDSLYYIILEDDIVLSNFSKSYSFYDFVNEKYKLIEESKKKFDIWLIGYIKLRDCETLPNTELKSSKTFIEPASICTLTDPIVNVTSFFGLHCYMISKEIATKLIKDTESVTFQIDGLLSIFSQLGKVNIIAFTNTSNIIKQGGFISDLDHKGDICNVSERKLASLTSNQTVSNISYVIITVLIIIIVILLINVSVHNNIHLEKLEIRNFQT